jgi:tetratricopeptide (TPR) repeat protein/TolB-like protein
MDSEATLGGDSSAPSAAASSQRPATGAAVLTPPPSGMSSTPAETSGGISWSSLESLVPGTEFGPRYRIEALLGEGGMGRVYKAYDKDLDRNVALKLLRPELTPNAVAMQRFKQELLLATKVSHKNILRIHDLGEAGGIKFISMAFVEGEDLSQRIKREGRLPVSTVVQIARQLCGALEAAHAEGILHRDLKPQNVLIDRSDVVYVSDFGLAKSLEAGAAAMTRAGEYLGTPRYMSPEQVEGKPLDARSDLYSLGLILYEMVSGEVPFKGDSALQLMYQRVKQKPKSPREVNPEIPQYVEKVILRCLEKDVERRYQNAREIIVDLEGERATSGARSVQFSLPVLEGRGKWLMAGGGVLLLLLLSLAIPGVRHFVLRQPATNGGPSSGIPPLAQGKYLAVLPFRVLGDATALGYVAEGLSDAISSKLFQLRDVHTAASSAVEKVGEKDSLEKAARQLGVNLIVQGKVQGAGDRIRITVNLEDVAGGRRVWSQEFSGVAKDLLTLEDQIYNQLVSALAINPSSDELARGTARPTENIEAYDLYLKGRNAMRGSQDTRNVETAIRFYEDALKKDSGFALAYAGLTDASLQMYRVKKDPFWAQRALAAAQQAQRLNDKLPEVHFSLGSVFVATGKSSEAIAELKRALQLAPNSDEGYRRLGNAFLSRGEKETSIEAFRKAVEVNPYFWLNQNSLGNAYLQLGENEKALAAFRRVTELEPDNAAGFGNVGSAYVRMGKYEECIPWFQRAIAVQPTSPRYSNLGVAYFYLKRYTEALTMFAKAAELNPNEVIVQGNLGDAYRWSGQKDKARETYDKAIALAYKDLQVNPRSAGTLGMLALYYAKKEDAGQAQTFIRRARAIDGNNVELMYIEGVTQALAGRSSEALRSLREAFQKGYPAEEAKNDPELGNLSSKPEFASLLSEYSAKRK